MAPDSISRCDKVPHSSFCKFPNASAEVLHTVGVIALRKFTKRGLNLIKRGTRR